MRGAQGKALWLRSSDSLGSSPSVAISRYVNAGFGWIAPVVLGHGGEDRRAHNRGAELWSAIRAAELPSWPTWILPEPATWREELEGFLDFCQEVGAVGAMIDPEAEFRGEPEEARAFADAMRAGCDRRGLLFGITSYANPPADFPLEAFASADLGIAQTYDRDLQFLASKFTRSLALWRRRGIRVVYPAAGTHAHARREPKTAAELRRHLALIPSSPGVIVWPEVPLPSALWRVLASWVPARARGARGGGGALVVLGLLAAVGIGLATGKG